MTAAAADYRPTDRTRLNRRRMRGAYDRPTVHAILDAGFVCHVGHVRDGCPVVIPTIHWRMGERVYWHGAAGGRTAAGLEGLPVCLTVTHVDGLVLARSAFRHSANYRSVVIFGAAQVVREDAQRMAALRAMIDRLFPGRWPHIRPPDEAELAATAVMYLELDEVSAKIKAGPPMDREDDLGLPVWAGVIPLALRQGPPEPCPTVGEGAGAPPALAGFG